MTTYVDERRVRERRHEFYPAVLRGIEGLRVSWGGVWGGVLVAMGLFLLLTTLGVAIGRSAESAQADTGLLAAVASLWAAASLLVSLFVGGMVSTRVGGVYDRTTGFFEGALVWVVSVLLMFFFATSGISTVASGMFGLMSAPGPSAGAAAQRLDLASGDVNQVLARLNDPETSYRLAGATGIPENEVHLMLSEIEQRVAAARNDPARAMTEARRGAAELYAEARVGAQIQHQAADIQPGASRIAWMTFGALVLSLGAAVAGAMVGRREVIPRRARPGV